MSAAVWMDAYAKNCESSDQPTRPIARLLGMTTSLRNAVALNGGGSSAGGITGGGFVEGCPLSAGFDGEGCSLAVGVAGSSAALLPQARERSTILRTVRRVRIVGRFSL